MLDYPAIEHVYYKPISQIRTIDRLEDIGQPDSSDEIWFWDLDDTLIDLAGMVGSKKWREHLLKETSQEVHDKLTYLIARLKYPLHTVEPNTALFLQTKQAEGHIMLGLTARERNLWYYLQQEGVDSLTSEQLQEVGIDFERFPLPPRYDYLCRFSAHCKGIFFADEENKGDFVKKILRDIPVRPKQVRPKKIRFIDDKLKQVEAVQRALVELGIDHVCYHYTKVEEKPFDPLLANLELYYLLFEKRIVLDEEAAQLAKNYPERDASFYLHNAITYMEEQWPLLLASE